MTFTAVLNCLSLLTVAGASVYLCIEFRKWRRYVAPLPEDRPKEKPRRYT